MIEEGVFEVWLLGELDGDGWKGSGEGWSLLLGDRVKERCGWA